MRLAFLILLLACRSLFAATGDILSATVETNGWVLDLVFSGYTTNGPYKFGYDTNNSPSPTNWSAITLSVVSPGFNDDGTSNNTTRVIYVTRQLRLASPNQTLSDCLTNNGNANLRVALSDYVYFSDSNATFSCNAGWYSNNTATAGLLAINNSLVHPARCIANWSGISWQRITNSPMRMRAIGFHRSAQQGRPLRYMQFVARDTHSHATTNVVYTMSVDPTMTQDPNKVSEYIADMDISAFTQGDQIRCDFRAVPWIGDSGSILDTMDGLWSWPSSGGGMWCSVTNYCDLSNTYGPTRALVSTTGSDTTGIAANTTYWAGNQNPPAFLTINGALNAIKGTNNTSFSHNDCGGGIVFVAPGSYTWTGGSKTTSGTPVTWYTICTNGAGTVTITGSSGNQSVSGLTHVKGLNIASSGVSLFTGESATWCEDCSFNCTDTATFYQNKVGYFTYCTITNIAAGLEGFSGENWTPALIRGCDFEQVCSIMAYTCLANTRFQTNTSGNGVTFVDNYSAVKTPVGTNVIFAYNSMFGINGSSPSPIVQFGNTTNGDGYAIVQNIYEEVGTGNILLVGMCYDGGIATNFINVIEWNNTLIGNRENGPYNETGSKCLFRNLWSKQNNLWDDDNVKSDTFATANSARIGNWAELYGCGSYGNWVGNVNGIGTSSFTHWFDSGFPGIWSAETGDTAGTWPAGYEGFINNKAWDGTTDHIGFGNYRLTSTKAPMLIWSTRWVLPFDIEGTPRGLWDPPGAFASANPRKGSAFMSGQ